jgi:hypothetical protein
MELQSPSKMDTAIPKAVTVNVEPVKKEDAFARLMAGVVNDTAVIHHTTIEDEPKKEAEAIKTEKKSEAKPDSTSIAKTKTNAGKTIKKETKPATTQIVKKENGIAKTDTLNKSIAKTKTPLYRPKDTLAVHKTLSFIKMVSEQKTDTAYQIRYVDIPNKGPIDTVEVIIPFSEEHVTAIPKKDTVQKLQQEISNKEMSTQKAKDTMKAVIDSSIATTKKVADSIEKDTAHAIESKVPVVAMNKDCKDFATDNDIDKLRVQMLAMDNDDDRIATARNIFKLKCFSVKQVKALSEVFKNDEGKYKLFDATYLHVSDPGNFIQLESLLSDPYFVNRFKAMIR